MSWARWRCSRPCAITEGKKGGQSTFSNTYTAHDEAGHWLGDYNTAGTPIQQAIWLDDLPVGVMADKLYTIEPDHLGTPRAVIDPTRNVAVWRWDLNGEAFGATAPNQDPDLDGTNFVFNLRYPGQRYNGATGLNYNYFRDYEPGTGRYAQSDPIGLAGGISTYGYVAENPTKNVDPLGLQWLVGDAVQPGDNINSIFCDDLIPTFSLPNFPDYGCSGLTACARKHEQSHLADAGPTICAGNSGKKYIQNSDPALRLDSERRAFKAEIVCLRRQMREQGCGDHCQRVYELRIKDIQQKIIPTIDNGTYPKGARQ